uniref:Uncharacterized protein n=1 Tax=Knipowitschia caucasica TaxID=637954 RepID=A0AAV2JK26_KNICA
MLVRWVGGVVAVVDGGETRRRDVEGGMMEEITARAWPRHGGYIRGAARRGRLERSAVRACPPSERGAGMRSWRRGACAVESTGERKG